MLFLNLKAVDKPTIYYNLRDIFHLWNHWRNPIFCTWHIVLWQRLQIDALLYYKLTEKISDLFRKRKPEEDDTKEDVKKECVEKVSEEDSAEAEVKSETTDTKPEAKPEAKPETMDTDTA